MKFNTFNLSTIALTMLTAMAAYSGVDVKIQNYSDANQNKVGLKTPFTSSDGVNFFKDGNPATIIRAETPEEGEEPWIILDDNTAYMLSDINPGAEDSSPNRFHKLGNGVYFSAYNSETGREPYRISNGEALLLSDINPNGSSNPNNFVNFDGMVYFSADTGDGHQVFKITGNGAVAATDFSINGGAHSIQQLTPFGDWLYFSAETTIEGNELYRTNGQTTELVKELRAFGEDGVDKDSVMYVYDDRLFFNGYFSDQVGYDIHYIPADHSDPVFFLETTAGADSLEQLEDMQRGADGDLYFIAQKPLFTKELWHYDGVNPASQKGVHNWIKLLTPAHGSMYIVSNIFGNGSELYKMKDGFINAVNGIDGEVAELNEGDEGSSPSDPVLVNGDLYFTAETTGRGRELVKLDQNSDQIELAYELIEGERDGHLKIVKSREDDLLISATSNRRVMDFDPISKEVSDVQPNQLTGVDSGVLGGSSVPRTEYKGYVYFSGYTEENGTELWRTDGTTTEMVMDINPGNHSSNPTSFVIYKDDLYFSATTQDHGRELWRTNGIDTELVVDANPGTAGSNPRSPTVFNEFLFFGGTTEQYGSELLATDGQDLALAKDINVGQDSSFPSNLYTFNNKLWFGANDDVNGYELWMVNADYQVELVDLNANGSSSPSEFITVGDYMYFNARDVDDGMEVWVTDGEDLFMVVEDANPGAIGSQPKEHITDGEYLYYIANNGTNDHVFRASGITASELHASEVENFYQIQLLGGRLYALAENANTGRELWSRVGNDFTLLDDLGEGEGDELFNIRSTNGALIGTGKFNNYYLNVVNHAEANWLPLPYVNGGFVDISIKNWLSNKTVELDRELIVRGCTNKLGCELVTIKVNQLPESFVTGFSHVHSGDLVEIDASLSTDEDGEIVSFNWTQIEGPVAEMQNTDTSIMTFTAPALVGEEILKFQVDIQDNDAGVTNYVKWVHVYNEAPVAIINVSNSNPESGQVVTLDGSASSDDTAISHYAWSQTSGPAVGIVNADSSVANFTVIEVDAETQVELMLTVTDENGIAHSQTVVINIEPAKAENQAPTPVIAVNNLSPISGSLVTLDASASSDADGIITSYEWHQIDGIAISLDNNNLVSTSFIAPEVNEPTIVTIQLSVVDDSETSSQATVQIQIMPAEDENLAPNAVIMVSNNNPETDEQVTMDASNSSDSDGAIVSYQWHQVAGIEVVINGSDTAIASFTAPEVEQDTQLQFQLTVTDDEGASVVSSVFVNLQAKPNALPTANITANNMNPVSGTGVSLNGTSSVDTDGQIVSYQWMQTAGPQVNINNAAGPVATFTAPAVQENTIISFKLTVTDNDGATAEKEISLTVIPQVEPGNGNGNGGSTSLILLIILLGICMGRRRF